MQLHLLLEMAAEGVAGRAVLSDDGQPISYVALLDRSRAGAIWLAQQPGERLVFIGLNGSTLPSALFASSFAGRPFVPLNYRLPDEELRKLVARTAPAVVVVDAVMADRVRGIDGVTIVTRAAFDMACATTAGESQEISETEQDIAVLLFTSGTTGEPKIAVLRHANLMSYILSTVEYLGAASGDAALISVPPYHIAGISAILSNVYSGRRLVYLDAFDAEGWVGRVQADQVTHAMVVPTMLDRILDVLDRTGERLPALKAISYGGGRMPGAVIERALACLPAVEFVNAYGLTETSSTIAVLTAEDHRSAVASNDPDVRGRLGSVGRALPTVEVEIRDADGGIAPVGTSGEIYVRGDQVSGEYTHKRMLGQDGWFATNDAGWLDRDGYLFVEGRLDDVIVRGGENISPGEIEDVLRQHPAVRDVAVIGLPDDAWGERIAAVVVTEEARPSPETLAQWVKSRLRSTKTPERWEFRDDLPYNDTGKLLRRILKTELSGGKP